MMGGGVIRAMRRVAGRGVGVERAWKRKDRDLGGWIFEREPPAVRFSDDECRAAAGTSVGGGGWSRDRDFSVTCDETNDFVRRVCD